MASTTTYDTLKAFLQTTFSPTPVFDYDQVDTAQQQSKTQFIVLEEETQGEDLAAFGDRSNLCQREDGAILVHAFTPAPESFSAARTFADSIQDALRHRRWTNGLRVVDVLPPAIESMNNGLWTVASVPTFYQRDFHVAAPSI